VMKRNRMTTKLQKDEKNDYNNDGTGYYQVS
jgi:hypothetical protein